MWQRMLRKYNGLTYRKKFKCNECHYYSFRLEHDSYGECSNCFNCIDDKYVIEKIIYTDDFQGYYTDEELDENFEIIDESSNKILKEILKFNKSYIYSKKENEKIYDGFNKSNQIDSLLDDFVVSYYKKFPDREDRESISIINDIEYLLNLIEDCHFFSNQSLNELELYEFVTERYNYNIYYSGRFMINNAVFHIVSAWERLIYIISTLFEIEFDENNINTSDRLYNKLKKCNDFKGGAIYKDIYKIKSTGLFNKIDNMRKHNDHDISEYLNIMSELTLNKESSIHNLDKDLKPSTKNIHSTIEVIFDVIIKIIQLFKKKVIIQNNDINVHRSLKVDILENQSKIIYEMNPISSINHVQLITLQNNISKIIKKTNHSNLDEERKSLRIKSTNFNRIETLFHDIISRVKEINKCLLDIENCSNGSIYQFYPGKKHIINEQYFIYASISRIYACYDKLGKLVIELYDIKNTPKHFYFEESIKLAKEKKCISNMPIINDMEMIVKSINYKNLYQYRNRLFHIIRPGSIYGKEGSYIHQIKMKYLIFVNVCEVVDILEKILVDIDFKYKLIVNKSL
ncbi:Cthe_2314 family HEPN domain-containing protein [Tepidibacter sp. Z1-5]|uniref:Cthe_2314 family HEPN domain-containing protein n=1 Tax=Tepidibacter sp. Z1-5 TaxID=3134138 RepID=UPI0030C37D68